MIPRWSLRNRMLYQLWFGGALATTSLVATIFESRAAVIGVVLGVAIVIAGLVTRARIKAQVLRQPTRSLD